MALHQIISVSPNTPPTAVYAIQFLLKIGPSDHFQRERAVSCLSDFTDFTSYRVTKSNTLHCFTLPVLCSRTCRDFILRFQPYHHNLRWLDSVLGGQLLIIHSASLLDNRFSSSKEVIRYNNMKERAEQLARDYRLVSGSEPFLIPQ